MYTAHEDRLTELDWIPKPTAGAPLPTIVANDYALALAYIVFERDPMADGRDILVVHSDTLYQPIAVVTFRDAYAHYSGLPNDETIEGHPLADRGLDCYSVYEVHNSSWVRALEVMNSVHRRHDPSRFWQKRHFIFTFHDSAFECIADEPHIEQFCGTMRTAVQKMLDALE